MRNLLSQIKSRCENPNVPCYKNYGGKGIKCLLTEQDLIKLWERDNGNELNRPSIDRKNPEGNYEFSNCQFIELEENIVKERRKPVLQFSLKGDFLQRYISLSHAAECLNIAKASIWQNIKGKRNSAGGFIWEYEQP
jgi:hypothetical protein